MRRFFSIAIRLLPVGAVLFSYGCGVTGRQLTDFVASAGIWVGVQALMNNLQSSLTSQS